MTPAATMTETATIRLSGLVSIVLNKKIPGRNFFPVPFFTHANFPGVLTQGQVHRVTSSVYIKTNRSPYLFDRCL